LFPIYSAQSRLLFRHHRFGGIAGIGEYGGGVGDCAPHGVQGQSPWSRVWEGAKYQKACSESFLLHRGFFQSLETPHWPHRPVVWVRARVRVTVRVREASVILEYCEPVRMVQLVQCLCGLSILDFLYRGVV